MSNLYLFTAKYPYSTIENFLDDEIIYLSKSFNKVFIVPLDGDYGQRRRIPENCEVLPPLRMPGKRFKYYFCGITSVKSLSVVWKEFFCKKVFVSERKLKDWLSASIAIGYYLSCKTIRNVISSFKPEDVFYYYWGVGLNNLSLFINSTHQISRFHGEWDLWEESRNGYVPFRERVAKKLSMAAFISLKGEEYFCSKYPGCKTIYAPLGTFDYGKGVEKTKMDTIEIVSCSTVYPLKRVIDLFEILNFATNLKIEWTHMGGGQQFELLRNMVEEEAKDHLKVNLTGQIDHKEVLSLYKQKHFDVFINLSTNEGVPVSIMEAISFNIPIVATNVGATCEVVTEKCGILVDRNLQKSEILKAIKTVLNKDVEPRLFWEKNYNASKNYLNFCEKLKGL